jgi:hypothetical protein
VRLAGGIEGRRMARLLYRLGIQHRIGTRTAYEAWEGAQQ